MVVFEEGFEPLSAKIHRSIFEKLKSKKSGTFIIDDVGEKYIVGCSEIELTKGGEGYGFGGTFESIDHKKGNTGESWYVICSRQMSAALTPFTKSIKTIILISTAIILILVFVAYLFGRKIANPLSVINKATEKIGKGDFEYRIGVMGKDEFGNLGNSFNSMASKLQQTTTSIVELEHEITERKQAEKALRESEERYRTLVVNLPVAVYRNTPGPKGAFLMANPAFCKMFGFNNEEEVLDFTPANLYQNPKKRKEYSDNLIRKGVIKNDEWTLLKRDGTSVYTSITSRVVHGQDGEVSHFDSIMLDITDKKKMEDQLQQAQKIEAIGTLAGGIAHDFNNILGGIIGYAELAKMKAPEESNVIADLDNVIKSGNRAASLIKQILTISRQHKQEQRPVQVKYIINEALKLLRATLPTSIEIREDLAKDAGVVNADPTQMHQVIMNLGTNAGHAMQEDGGVLTVELANVDLDDIEAAMHLDMDAGSYLRLTVSDTGHGISPEIVERIFDPYFTTKDTGEGTGLGLSVAHGIVKAHGGAITVYSEPGKGTTFHVYLPLILEEERKEKETEEPLPSGSERILFIDDEPVLVEIGSQMLERLGYEVVTQKSSVQALELFRAEPDRFDLVITDMTMPHMTGDKLAQELMKIRPDIPIILCTGHNTLVLEEKAKEIGVKAFVMKPLVMRNLAETVRKVLDEK